MASKLKLYSAQRKRFLEENPICPVTGQMTTQVHHMRLRGKYLLDETTWLAVSTEGHEWIETHKNQAREKGWILYK